MDSERSFDNNHCDINILMVISCDGALPGGRFADAASLRKFRPEARAYEAIIAADLDEADLWPALAALGFDRL